MNKKHIIITLAGAAVICLICMAPGAIKRITESISRHNLDVAYEDFLESNTGFYEGTTINGIDVAGLDSAGALQKLTDEFESKTLTITNPWNDTVDTLPYKNLNIDFSNLNAFINASFDTRNMTEEQFADKTYVNALSYDITKDIDLAKADLTGISVVNEELLVPSSDAALTYDIKSGKVDIVEEVYGNIFKEDVFKGKLSAAILEGADTLSFDKEDYILPEVTADDEAFLQKKATIENYLNKTVELSLCGMGITIDNEDIRTFIDVDAEDGLSDDAMQAYVKKVCGRFNTYGDSRPFTTSTGESIMIPGGNYGWLIDDAGTAGKIKKALASDKSTVKTEAAYKVQGQRPADDEISNTYVEVSLRDQRIWMYKDGQLIVSDDCTTGMVGDPECHTNVGTFRLTYKTTNRVLKGPTWEDFVYFWMPFDGGIGLHDATWRTEEEFGGDNRYGNGSHGCVNLRLATAETVYNNMEDDVPIIVWE